MSSDAELNPFEQELLDSEDEIDWEEVEVPAHLDVDVEEPKHIEIILKPLVSSKGKKKAEDESKKKGITHEERLMRINCHKIHTVVLLANAKVRNKWINDELLQARLLSLTPIALQNEFAQIHPSRIPDKGQRGRMFERALQHLASWWMSFFDVLSTGHIRNRTFDEVQSKLESFGLLYDEGEVDRDTFEDILGCELEIIKGPKSLMKHALNREGSRDVSAQLFTSLCRALGIPARLVVSLQSVPWQPSVGRPKPTYKRKDTKSEGKGKAKQEPEVDGDSSSFAGTGQRLDGKLVPMSEKAKGKQRAEPVIKLRKQKDKGHKLGSDTPASSSRQSSPNPVTTPPVFWTEVFSRPDSRWMPVDPVRGLVNKRKAFDPTPTPAGTVPGTSSPAPNPLLPPRAQPKPANYYSQLPKGTKQENRMLYVMAFEEDGFARDVTRRYARDYNSKIAKHQGGSNASNSGGKARQMWWERVVGLVKRSYQLQRDDIEDEELNAAQMQEGMPTTIAGFKDHPLYVLTRHLKQSEVIHPPPPETPEIGKFRGEPVYPRSSVVPLKSAETWMRTEGRIIKAGCQPLKTVKARAATVNKLRELEVRKDELMDAGYSAESVEVMQGLYARSQTEVYVPPPVVDGKIPKNDFGNIDMYAPTMLPKGAVHLPYKGIAKIAKKLGFDYAEAVTGFEFRKRRANAVIEGIVIATENESAILDAYWEHQKAEDEKARAKKEEKALQHWIKLVQGLRIRQRLQEEYADRGTPSKAESSKNGASAKKTKRKTAVAGDEPGEASTAGETSGGFLANDDDDELEDRHGEGHGGGFLVEADDVVQAFNLPKYNPLILESTSNPFASSSRLGKQKHHHHGTEVKPDDNHPRENPQTIDYATYDLEDLEEPALSEGTMDVDVDMESEGGLVEEGVNRIEGGLDGPKTMEELEADARSKDVSRSPSVEVLGVPSAPVAETVSTRLRSRRGAANGATPNGVLTPKVSSRPSRIASGSKRKREDIVDGDESEDGQDDASDVAASGGEYGVTDAEVDLVDGDDGDDGTFGSRKPKRSPRGRKRPRAAARAPAAQKSRTPVKPRNTRPKAPIAPPVPTDRVLRSRR